MTRKKILKKISNNKIINLGSNAYNLMEYIIDFGEHKIAESKDLKEVFSDAILLHYLSVERIKKEELAKKQSKSLLYNLKFKLQDKKVEKIVKDIIENCDPDNIKMMIAIDLSNVKNTTLNTIDILRTKAGLMEYSILKTMQENGYLVIQYLTDEEKETLNRIQNIEIERINLNK